MTDDQPDLHELAGLARTGRDELARLDRRRDAALWADIEARLDATDAAPTAAAHPTWRSRLPLGPVTAAAAVALVVGVTVGGLLGRSTAPAPATLATIQLEPLTDDVTATTAALLQGPDGRTISVDLSGLPTTDGFHEVWLLDPDTGALVSLGPVRTDGEYEVPPTIDLVELPVLDVSVEPHDGDPAHSGDSLLRGEVTLLG